MRIRAVAGWALVAILSIAAGGCGGVKIDPNLPAITTEPVDVTAAAGSTATFTVVATGQAPLSYQWFAFAQPIKGATSATYTTATLAPSDNDSFYYVLVTNSIGSIESDEVLLTVTTSAPPPGVTANALGNANPSDVLTAHNDVARTGQYLGETLLTPANLNSTNFGKLGTLMTDGQVDSQPLYASGVTLPSGSVRNILYAASEHGSVYAFDAANGAVIWQTGINGANEQPADSGTWTSAPQEGGITATPVIDRTRGPHGAIYVIANTKDSAGTVIQRIHALDIASGAELFSGPTLIQAYASAANNGSSAASENFDASQYQPLAGLQLANGKVYAAWGPNCSAAANSGWVMGFDAATLNPSASLYLAPRTSPTSPEFALAGLSVDSTGGLYVFSQTIMSSQSASGSDAALRWSAGNAFLKFSTENGLALSDYTKTASSNSASPIASVPGVLGGATILPDFTDEAGNVWHLALGPGSDGNIYVLNRDALGGSGQLSMPIIQMVEGAASSTAVTPAAAYYGNTVYFAASGNSLKAFTVSDARLSTAPANQSSNALGASGAQIAISANGTNGGIVWALENGAGILHAYNAANLSQEIYNSTQAPNSRDAFASTFSLVSPTIAGGRVYVVTKNGIVVFGQLK